MGDIEMTLAPPVHLSLPPNALEPAEGCGVCAALEAAPRTPTAKFRSRSEVVDHVSYYCGLCISHRSIWCPNCSGFEGCATCKHTTEVPCPLCAGGTLEPIR